MACAVKIKQKLDNTSADLALIVVFAMSLALGIVLSLKSPAVVAPTKQTVSVIYERDSGQTFTYNVPQKFIVILDQGKYRREDLDCSPGGILKSLPQVSGMTPPLYAAKFQAAAPGVCTLKSGDFNVTIKVWAMD